MIQHHYRLFLAVPRRFPMLPNKRFGVNKRIGVPLNAGGFPRKLESNSLDFFLTQYK
jgi:hypothetical protein